jgi:hypothetical protein
MNYPNQWVAGQEYDFGNGLYGKRITGTITATANTQNNVNIVPAGVTGIVSSGGSIGFGDSGATGQTSLGQYSVSSAGSTAIASDVRRLDATGALNLVSSSASARTGNANSQYDVWVKYTK